MDIRYRSGALPGLFQLFSAVGLVMALVVAVAVVTPPVAAAGAARDTGPEFTSDRASLDRSLSCHGDVEGSGRNTVLLLHGTTSNSEANWSWTWEPALAQEGRPYCTVDLPLNGMQDIQISAENVTHAIRTVAERSGRKVDIVGHSQGGMIGRWTTKWWPDTRDMVDNMVGFGSSNHGSDLISLLCTVACPESLRQQGSDSEFLAALNESPETFPSIRYTTIATRFDEIVFPHDKAFLPPAPNVNNITLQDQCPGEPVEHFLLAASNPVWELALQALDGRDEPQVTRDACMKLMPGVDPTRLHENIPAALVSTVEALVSTEWNTSEPELRDYARS
ncbi:alpha/beta fold hydrolase [Corynebacteriaceae bacterium 7-707]